MKRREWLALGGMAGVALGAGLLAGRWLRGGWQAENAGARPAFVLQDLDGKTRHAGEWDGQVLLVNFWASWCPPCRAEMPGFIRVRERLHARGFEVLGIALDEADPARRFAQSIAVNYPILLGGDAGLSLAIGFGNTSGGLPYSALVDRTGRIARTKTGELSEDEAETAVSALL
jgi:thiol-disulfide isomerase/thioredoxin